MTLARVALFSLPLLWLQTQQSLAVCPPACGIGYTVDSTGDGNNVGPSTQCSDGTGHCTLRAAIQASNAHAGVDGIFFNIPTAGNNCDASGNCTINLGTALPDLSDGVNIQGPGADKLTVMRSTASGTTQFRIFNVTTTGTVTFSGLTIANGSPVGNGGGIQNVNAGIVNVTDSTLLGNRALSSSNNSNFAGGGIFNSSTGALNVTNSTLTSNHVTASGANNASGGGIFNAGTVNIINSTITGNSADTPNGSASGGGIYNAGTMNLSNSTLHNNGTSPGQGQVFAVNASGGGIFNLSGTANVTNCTLSVNYTFASGSVNARGGGIFNDTGTVNLTNSTLSSNYCSGFPSPGMFGGGIFNGTGVFRVRSTIIALGTVNAQQNAAIGSGPDVSGTFTSQGFNLIGKRDGGAGFTTDPTDQTGTIAAPLDPKFELDGSGRPFPKDNGGPTQTIALQPGSPAINKGNNANAVRDQRNYTRQDTADAGAYEFNGLIPATLANISTRLSVDTGDNALIGGFIVTGTHDKRVIVLAVGPSLPFPDKLANPTLELYQGNTLLESNDDWITSANKQAIMDSGAAPGNNLESAIIRTLPANNAQYTAIVRGANSGKGIGSVQVYDLDRTTDSKLANISTRGVVLGGDNIMIAGFIISGADQQRVIVLAIGPSLTVPGKLTDPTLQLVNQQGTVLDENDNWGDSANKQAIIDSGVAPTNAAESAIIATLPSGNAQYTAIVRGVGGATGVAVVQVYALN